MNSFVRSFSIVFLLLLFSTSRVFSATVSPQRIVSVGGSITEIIYALEMQEHIVAVDSSSLWPPAATKHQQVGYQRTLSAEGILSLTPDLVLATVDAGPDKVLEQIEQTGTKITILPNTPDIEGVLQKIRLVAKAIGREEEGEILVERTRKKLLRLENQIVQVNDRPRVMFLFSAGRSGPMVSGSETVADGMIVMAGGRNAITDFQGYKPLNTEAMIAAEPDVVLTTERSLKALGGTNAVLQLPGVQQTPAGAAKRIHAMDGLLLLGMSPRSPKAIATLARIIHPDIKIDD